jgi:8-oxo-dGTP pyrophosphatase MutT (NUDIX family)
MSSAAVPGATRPVIRDPGAVPVVGTDAHLPPVALERLQPAWLRQRLTQAHRAVPAIAGDGAGHALGAGRSPAAASVLVPLVQRSDGLQVLLTRRTDHLRDHAGQISFPGGRAEPEDADAVATALRETEEEVGLPRSQVEVIGAMPVYTTVTRFVVTPIVGLVAPDYRLRLDSFEVAEAFEVPLTFLMTPAHHQRHEFELDGAPRHFLSMPWRPDAERPDAYFIWGATAAMLRNLYHLLSE